MRDNRTMVKWARALWVAWAVVLWNVLLDRAIVVAGRDYIRAAFAAARAGAAAPSMDQWMRPAVARGLWIASAAAAGILAVGWSAIAYACRDPRLSSER
jgi:hypothetical protein